MLALNILSLPITIPAGSEYSPYSPIMCQSLTNPDVFLLVCGSVDRIQQLRREYQQARREGIVPPYEELDPRRRGHENDAHRVRSSIHTHI